jgi:sugar-specific transcriptional regulator TrmB
LDHVIEELGRLGFSQYESKAYVGLLTRSPVTGYELAKRSGIPRSMVYETLGKLVDRGAAHLVPSEPVMYAPVPAAVLLERYRQRNEETFGYLQRELGAIEKSPEMDVVAHVRGEVQINTEIVSIVDQARSELWLALWAPQVELLRQPVARALERNVTVFSVLFGDETSELGWTFRHSYMAPEVVKRRLGGHLTIAARDAEEVVIAEYIDVGGSWAVKTRDPALVLVATDYVRHDIMFDVIVPEFGVDRLTSIWEQDPRLVHVLTGRPARSAPGGVAGNSGSYRQPPSQSGQGPNPSPRRPAARAKRSGA